MRNPDRLFFESADAVFFLPDNTPVDNLNQIIMDEVVDGDKLVFTLDPRYKMNECAINKFCDYLKTKTFSVAILKNFKDHHNCVMAFNKKNTS